MKQEMFWGKKERERDLVPTPQSLHSREKPGNYPFLEWVHLHAENNRNEIVQKQE